MPSSVVWYIFNAWKNKARDTCGEPGRELGRWQQSAEQAKAQAGEAWKPSCTPHPKVEELGGGSTTSVPSLPLPSPPLKLQDFALNLPFGCI